MEDNCTSGKENITFHYFFHIQSLIISSPLNSSYHFICQHIVEITYLFPTKVLLYHVPLIETLGAYVPAYRMKSSILLPSLKPQSQTCLLPAQMILKGGGIYLNSQGYIFQRLESII